jgi:hypothetical protein
MKDILVIIFCYDATMSSFFNWRLPTFDLKATLVVVVALIMALGTIKQWLTHLHIITHNCTHNHTHTLTHTSTLTPLTHTYTHTHAHHIQAHTHTHTHTHMHTRFGDVTSHFSRFRGFYMVLLCTIERTCSRLFFIRIQAEQTFESLEENIWRFPSS